MNKEEQKILLNIIGGVESGGQVYGKRDYAAYAPAYKNSKNEHTCTLGWAQNYGAKARELVNRIFAKDKKAFRKIDSTGRIEEMLGVDWEKSKWNPNEDEKATLIALITSDQGKKAQDEMFFELMDAYINVAIQFGVKATDIPSQMMWCEIEHLGGYSPTKRIFQRAKKPYTPDTILESLLLDQQDSSNSNQVGDKKYENRHRCCVKWIKEYVMKKENETVGVTADDVLDILSNWVGKSRANGTHKDIIDLYNSYQPLARGYKVSYKDAYCDTTVSAAFIKANAVDLIGGTECGVEEHIKIFKKKGIWEEDGTIVPKRGYICCYNWDTRVQPNDGYADHIGIVETVESNGKTFVVIEGNMEGGIVGRRVVDVGWGAIRGFAIPKYAAKSSKEETKEDDHTVDKPELLTDTPTRLDNVLFVGEVTASMLNVRTWAGTEYPNIKTYPRLAKGNLVDVLDYTQKASDGTPWYFVRIYLSDKKTSVKGFVSSKYIRNVV